MGQAILYTVLTIILLCEFHVVEATLQEVIHSNTILINSSVAFLDKWSILGPFRIGTREAIWGADPVEQFGGIFDLNDNDTVAYRSPLAQNATVRWNPRTFRPVVSEATTTVDLVVDFPEVDWDFAQKIYGWSALQYQAWVRGGIWNDGGSCRRVSIYPEGILELWLNKQHIFGGDFYSFGHAPIVFELVPGFNLVNVRLVRDVRSMGGSSPPTAHARLRAEVVAADIDIVHDSLVLPDVIAGRFAGRYGSVVVRNQAAAWISVKSVRAIADEQAAVAFEGSVAVAPGQSRLVRMRIDNLRDPAKTIKLVFNYAFPDANPRSVAYEAQLRHANHSSLQKLTFLHPSGAVSYATLRPPPRTVDREAPILLNLHGAGVDADGDLARHMFEDAPHLPAWVLTPTGMTSWSSDDWHTWGFADALTAVDAITEWVSLVKWQGPDPYTSRILVTGHSNGGQGTWYFATHQPDRVLGAAAASGYLSIDNYVPYVYWAEADPLQAAILHTARSNFRHELLAENLAGIPIFQQHGSADDNVPVYHSRLMNTLLCQAGIAAKYSEMLGIGHWVDGTMTTPPMIEFYLAHLNGSDVMSKAPDEFAFVVPNSHDMGSKYGIVVDQLSSPDRMGHIRVSIAQTESVIRWHLRTQNIHRLHFDPSVQIPNSPDEVLLDGMTHAFRLTRKMRSRSLVQTENKLWGWEVALDWRQLDQRYGRQRGALDSILRSRGAFEIVSCSAKTFALAVQASRNFLQYFGADSNIVTLEEYAEALSRRGNLITIGLGTSLPRCDLSSFPISLQHDGLLLTTGFSNTISIPFRSGMGGVWLRPLSQERLELVVWGHDEDGLRQAMRLVPTLTGAGQPDFVILDNDARWKGARGAIAMGFFDRDWRISSASYLP
ncbi:hypothetical protein PV08_02585 [Exophiala spinifera]|uniref:Peptidase S9 prolyl oligopeptidase catalytic domain-containing protein n=1 Tax=Exophiala spinifera TaxID=91928 RepID=A0A0D1ZZY8_9EURO|nr:uncharacterized protein PV08_02585 [Exophiala spinifera]KIW18297.1 hypothetical protein PV08_02585 [Exophiala spinifera]